jgi:DNA (cytosine-5)-methyltransferase 1
VSLDGKKFSRLMPVELARLNMFPDGHTEGVSDAWRAFFMGNALVVGIVERIGRSLIDALADEGQAMPEPAAALHRK